MSAQAGIWNFNDKPVDQTLAERLSTAIAYYGPDRASRHMENSIGMVYRAFQTTPESHTERQPYVSGHGNVITWDGRIDNRSELISLLGTEMVGDRTDVAIVAAAFDRWGSGCFRRIIGDWAISIWRPTERELLFACDFMAIRHIFYHLRKECVYWSTDLASLVPLSGHKFHIDDDFIAGYLAYEPDCHLTPYREIRQVPAGQFVRVQNNGNISMERYWQFSPEFRIRYKSDEEYEDHFRHVFRQAVRRRLRSNSAMRLARSSDIRTPRASRHSACSSRTSDLSARSINRSPTRSRRG